MSERDNDGFDWKSPRWREGEDDKADAQRDRRFRDRRPPDQRGAIDGGASVPGGDHEVAEPLAGGSKPSTEPAATSEPSPESPTTNESSTEPLAKP